MARGARGRCPRCNDAKLFHRFLKPVATCPRCRQDWTHQQADDFPAYVSILLNGHIMAPIIIALVQETALSLAALAAIIVSSMLIRSEEHTSELQSLMRTSYAVFCLKKKTTTDA